MDSRQELSLAAGMEQPWPPGLAYDLQRIGSCSSPTLPLSDSGDLARRPRSPRSSASSMAAMELEVPPPSACTGHLRPNSAWIRPPQGPPDPFPASLAADSSGSGRSGELSKCRRCSVRGRRTLRVVALTYSSANMDERQIIRGRPPLHRLSRVASWAASSRSASRCKWAEAHEF